MRIRRFPKKSAAEKRRERQELIQQGLSLPPYDPPRRLLALDDWGESKINPEEFASLRERVVSGALLEYETRTDEVIARACLLLFALVESGGLCVAHPERMLPKIKLDRRTALLGYLRQPGKNSETAKNTAVSTTEVETNGSAQISADNADAENPANEQSTALEAGRKMDGEVESDEEEIGVRQPLHLLGRNHLLAFTYFRLKIQKETDGKSPLLPALPRTAGELRREISFEWLKKLDRTPKWTSVFNRWLKYQISRIRDEADAAAIDVDWKDVSIHAAWSLLRREKFPLLVGYRRRLFSTTLLPEQKIKHLLALNPAPFGIAKKTRPSETDADSVLAELFDESAGSNEEEVEGEKSVFDAGSAEVRKFLNSLLADDYTRRKAIDEIDKTQKLKGFDDPRNFDLVNLLRWAEELVKKNKPRTVHRYGAQVLRFLTEIAPRAYADCTTGDIAAFMDNTCGSPNTVRAVREALVLFAEFLERSGLPHPLQIEWDSRELKAFERECERDILTEAEYQTVRQCAAADERVSPEQKLENLVLLTFLRRCGLRVSEASWLDLDDLLGLTECRLLVPRSKTRAGRRRIIPLFHLLDETELDEVDEFFVMRSGDSLQAGDPAGFIFVEPDGTRSKAESLGSRAERLLRNAGIDGERAHGLRHALASALFAALWLKTAGLLDGSGDDDDGYKKSESLSVPKKILEGFCREGIEGRAVSHPFHIQQILGHADMFVTFGRYIHLVELAVRHAVELWERGSEPETMLRRAAARLMRIDDRQLREKLDKSGQNSQVLSFSEFNLLLQGRL